MKLYEISNAIHAILGEDMVDLSPDAEERLAELQMSREEKLANYIRVAKNYRATQAAAKEEIRNLQAKLDAARKGEAWIESVIQKDLAAFGEDSFADGVHRAKRCKNPPKVVVDDESEEFLESLRTQCSLVKEKRTLSLDRTEALQQWKDGLTLPVGVSVVVGEHLRIT